MTHKEKQLLFISEMKNSSSLFDQMMNPIKMKRYSFPVSRKLEGVLVVFKECPYRNKVVSGELV
jgi:hypothetical protein